MTDKHKFSLSTTQIIMLSFLLVILIGSVLLCLPVSSADGQSVPYVDALFTSTTATCVTGLVTLPTFSTWSLFGQIVILVLIQIGGLGVITVMTGVMVLLNRKLGISDRLLIQDAFNLKTMTGLIAFVKRVIVGTLAVELTGACFYMTVFVPEFGARGIWISVFNAISAFCNAGIDIIGENSHCDYAANPIITVTTSLLIVLGGIGFIVWWDLLRVIRTRTKGNRRVFRYLTLHSKIAILSTVVLLVVGAALFLIAEWDNPLTMRGKSVTDKIQMSFFQSVTVRTAGFASMPQENLTNASSLVALLLMFIGGSPCGTAGGVKTVTVTLLLSAAYAAVRRKNDISLLGRSISEESIHRAIAVVTTSFSILFLSALLMTAVTDASIPDILFESVSATATVGLSRNLTSTLNTAGKIIILCTMYFGRVGPISLVLALDSGRASRNIVREPREDVSIG